MPQFIIIIIIIIIIKEFFRYRVQLKCDGTR